MCGRYALAALKDEVVTEFNIETLTPSATATTLPADWNIAPTKDIYLIKASDGPRVLDIASWGLIAPWSRDDQAALRSQSMAINARSESVHIKPTFRDSFRARRCLVPASGYYEWATELGQYPRKQPIYISSREEKLLAFSGIYSYWRSESGELKQSVAIITRDAVGELAKVHNRMPLFLPRDRWERWLDGDTPEPEVLHLMEVEEPDRELQFWPVRNRVNSIRNNGAELIAEIELGESETLF